MVDHHVLLVDQLIFYLLCFFNKIN